MAMYLAQEKAQKTYRREFIPIFLKIAVKTTPTNNNTELNKYS